MLRKIIFLQNDILTSGRYWVTLWFHKEAWIWRVQLLLLLLGIHKGVWIIKLVIFRIFIYHFTMHDAHAYDDLLNILSN